MPALPSPKTRAQLVDEYFLENRTKILDIAAFLDRLDRAGDGDDFRMAAFRQALEALTSTDGPRIQQVQMIFSDPTTEPLEALTEKNARGAYNANGSHPHTEAN